MARQTEDDKARREVQERRERIDKAVEEKRLERDVKDLDKKFRDKMKDDKS
jgi:hypothetical protein